MLRALIVLALWAVWPASGQVGSIALYTEFQSQASPVVVQAIQEEVDSLMSPDGLRLEWRHLPSTGSEVSMEVAVVTFEGRCSVLGPADQYPENGRLGWSHVSDGEVLPFADVDCDSVRSYVRKGLSGVAPQLRDAVFGRAVGRVVAHELLHVFARTVHHSSHGVDQPAFSVAELLSDGPAFGGSPYDLHILRLSTRVRPRFTAGSPEAGKAAYVRGGCGSCHGADGEGSKRAPVLRVAGRLLNSVVLAAKLAKSEKVMAQKARSWKVAAPSLSERELQDLLRFLNSPLP